MGPTTSCYCLGTSWEPLIKVLMNYDQQILFTSEMKHEEQNACGGSHHILPFYCSIFASWKTAGTLVGLL